MRSHNPAAETTDLNKKERERGREIEYPGTMNAIMKPAINTHHIVCFEYFFLTNSNKENSNQSLVNPFDYKLSKKYAK